MSVTKFATKLMAGSAIIVLTTLSATAAAMPKISGFSAATGERAATGSGGLVQLVQRRRGGGARGRGGRGARARGRRGRGGFGRRRGRRGRGIGPAIGAGIAAAIIGGAIASSKRNYGGRWERCDDRFKTFRYSDGTYQPYGGGPRRLCPYLRN